MVILTKRNSFFETIDYQLIPGFPKDLNKNSKSKVVLLHSHLLDCCEIRMRSIWFMFFQSYKGKVFDIIWLEFRFGPYRISCKSVFYASRWTHCIYNWTWYIYFSHSFCLLLSQDSFLCLCSSVLCSSYFQQSINFKYYFASSIFSASLVISVSPCLTLWAL